MSCEHVPGKERKRNEQESGLHIAREKDKRGAVGNVLE